MFQTCIAEEYSQDTVREFFFFEYQIFVMK